MKHKLTISVTIAFIVTMFVATSVYAQDGNPPTPQPPLLDSSQVYILLMAALVGSLGTIGLLLGIDRLIIGFKFKDSGTSSKREPRLSGQSILKILPIVIEGITVILVVLAVLLLGLLKITTSEGTIGLLGSIVGYVLGKGTRAKSDNNAIGEAVEQSPND